MEKNFASILITAIILVVFMIRFGVQEGREKKIMARIEKLEQNSMIVKEAALLILAEKK